MKKEWIFQFGQLNGALSVVAGYLIGKGNYLIGSILFVLSISVIVVLKRI